MASRGKRVPIPLRQRFDDLRRGPLALLVWGGAAFAAVQLLGRRAAQFEFLGMARSLAAEVSAEVDGRLAEVLVQPFDEVALGQPLARLDDGLLVAEIAATNAAIEILQARLETERAQLAADAERAERDRVTELRRCLVDEKDRRLERLAVEIDIEANLVEIERLGLSIARSRNLVAQGFASDAELDDLTLARAGLEATVRESRELVEELAAAEAEAAARRRVCEEAAPAPLPTDLAPLLETIRAEELRVESIRVGRRSLTLAAPFAGQVSQVLAEEGQALLAGEPVALVVRQDAGELVAYVPERALRSVREGTRVLVARRDDPHRRAEALVTRLGLAVEELPVRLWRDPTWPEFGRPALIAGVEALDLAPGDVALVRPIE